VARLYITHGVLFLKRLHRIIQQFRNVLYRKYLRKPHQSAQPLKNHERVVTGRAAGAESTRHKFIMLVSQPRPARRTASKQQFHTVIAREAFFPRHSNTDRIARPAGTGRMQPVAAVAAAAAAAAAAVAVAIAAAASTRVATVASPVIPASLSSPLARQISASE